MDFEQFLKRVCYHKLANEAHVFKTWYKTAPGRWTENPDEADWQPWHNLPNGALCCDIRHEEFYLIDGKLYDNIDEAIEAIEYEIFKPHLINLILEFFKTVKRREQNQKRRLSKLIYHNEVAYARTN